MKRLAGIFLLFPILIWSQTPFLKAEKLFGEGKYALAKPVFENYLKQNPNDSKTMEYLGDIAGHQKQWDDAISYYKKLKTRFPQEAGYYYKFGGALGMKAKESSKFKALGMIDDIEEAFLTAAKLDGKHIETRWALVMLYLELPGIVGGSEAKAKKYSDELLRISPVDGYLSKGYIFEYVKKYKDAEKQYTKAIEIGQSKTAYQKLADLYKNKMNSPEKAKQILDLYQKKKT
ncbi:tetratricopeptide repeat protein [Flavobacterium humi]|uniref:Tetratricopeptide repeat protein n=1 Tax=Flavobacterium humi TaxID=2562683 RepID=A0A4Z0L4A2_9FLAO|nr:tetratricopeptide repeat protein [Flavobacterium humi]TGD57069.1 tetratricopeptide repeat protein [Flavobacterium humi]